MANLVLLRHGQSLWNRENRFTGWVDVDLTEEGEAQARRAGALIAAAGFEPDVVLASVLKRAIRTAWLALEAMDRVWAPVTLDWRLNERHYGALTGLDKAETAARHGEEQVQLWRRSFEVPPPALALTDPRHPARDPRYAKLDPALLPATESLKTTLARVGPCWTERIAPRLEAGERVLVAAHGNSLRALVKSLFALSDEAILEVEIPTGSPLALTLAPQGLKVQAARYLDPSRAALLPAYG